MGGEAAIRKAVSGAEVVAMPGGGGDELNLQLAEKSRNDIGNSERFLARHGVNVMYVREVGWHHWVGTHWETEGAEEAVRQKAHETAKAIFDELQAVQRGGKADHETMADFNKRQEDLFKWAYQTGNKPRIEGMITEASPYVTVGPDALDADPLLLNLTNGTMRLEGACDRLRPHRRGDRQAKLMPVKFDPKAECPLFMAFLERVQPDPEVRNFLQRWAGYSLTGRTNEQKLVFHYGGGANGKSVFLNLRAKMMGPYAAAVSFSSIAQNDAKRGDSATPDLARLPGVRFARVSESDKGVRLSEAFVKEVTGEDTITVRHLHQGFFEFTPAFKLEMQGNHKPIIRGQDEGIWRRVNLVPWEVTIPPEERDLQLPAKLWEERSGILNWLLSGLCMWLEDGLCIPERVRAATAEFRNDSDPLGRFIAACVIKSPGDAVGGAAMYDAFRKWCGANAERPWSQTAFGRALGDRGLEKERIGGIVRYVGVRLDNIPDGSAGEPPPPEPDDYD